MLPAHTNKTRKFSVAIAFEILKTAVKYQFQCQEYKYRPLEYARKVLSAVQTASPYQNM